MQFLAWKFSVSVLKKETEMYYWIYPCGTVLVGMPLAVGGQFRTAVPMSREIYNRVKNTKNLRCDRVRRNVYDRVKAGTF